MRQIPISNMVYILDIMVVAIKIFIIVEIENDDIRVNTICPAVMLAARRNLRVIGRTVILINSTKTRKGFSHIGALSGSK